MVLREMHSSFPKGQILGSSKPKEFTVDGSGEEFSTMVENNVGKGEVAHYEQFSHFSSFFFFFFLLYL